MDVARPDLMQRKQRRRWMVAAIIVVALAGGVIAIGSLGPAMPEFKRDNVIIDTVKRGELLRAVRGPGKLVPREMRWITAESASRVERILVRPGAAVKSDTIVMELSNPTVESAFSAAQAAYDAGYSDQVAKRMQLRSEMLELQSSLAEIKGQCASAVVQEEAERLGVEKGVIAAVQHKKSKIELDQLKIRLGLEQQRVAEFDRNLKAQLSASQVRLDELADTRQLRRRERDNLALRAGLDGVLQQVLAEEGQRVTIGDNLARVARPGALIAELRIAETQAKDLQIGQLVHVDTHDAVVDGKVRRIDPAVQAGTVHVEVELVGPLPVGARADLSIDGEIEIERMHDVVYVGRPVNSLPGLKTSVFRLTSADMAERVSVRFGKDSVNAIQILSGLGPGDQIMISDMSSYDAYTNIRIK